MSVVLIKSPDNFPVYSPYQGILSDVTYIPRPLDVPQLENTEEDILLTEYYSPNEINAYFGLLRSTLYTCNKADFVVPAQYLNDARIFMNGHASLIKHAQTPFIEEERRRIITIMLTNTGVEVFMKDQTELNSEYQTHSIQLKLMLLSRLNGVGGDAASAIFDLVQNYLTYAPSRSMTGYIQGMYADPHLASWLVGEEYTKYYPEETAALQLRAKMISKSIGYS